VLGCDPADKGRDFTVMYAGWEDNGRWQVKRMHAEGISEQTKVAGRIALWQQEMNIRTINIDYGMGAGIISILKTALPHKKLVINSCLFGGSPKDKRRFQNKKAEMYFHLAQLFKERRIKVPKDERIMQQLLAMKWEKHMVSGKIRIIDPEEKSPDFADALVYLVWQTGSNQQYLIA
jgi:hypothetical protein